MPWLQPSIYLSLLTNYKEILWEDFGHLIIQGKQGKYSKSTSS